MPIGTREQVWSGAATHTSGGLTKSDLFFDSKDGKIKSKRKSAAARARFVTSGAAGARRASIGDVMRRGPLADTRVVRGLPGGELRTQPATFGGVVSATPHPSFNVGPILVGSGAAKDLFGVGSGLSREQRVARRKKWFGVAKKVASGVLKVATSPVTSLVVDTAIDLAKRSGIAKAEMLAMKVEEIKPLVVSAAELIQSKVGSGAHLPMGQGGVVSATPHPSFNVGPVLLGSGASDDLFGVGVGGRLFGRSKAERVAARKKWFGIAKTVASGTLKVATSPVTKLVVDTAIDLAKKSGVPKVQIVAMAAEQVIPLVQEAASLIQSQIEGGAVLPRGPVLPGGRRGPVLPGGGVTIPGGGVRRF